LDGQDGGTGTHILDDRLDRPGTFEARDKGKRLRVVSGAVIDVK
jgi:hypothetical protein